VNFHHLQEIQIALKYEQKILGVIIFKILSFNFFLKSVIPSKLTIFFKIIMGSSGI